MESTATIEALLAPGERPVRVLHLAIRPELIVVYLVARHAGAACPGCGRTCHRVHSRYVRTIADLPWRGIPVVLRWQVRRLFCENIDCPRRIFAEQVLELVGRRGRTTAEFDHQLARIGLTCGGEPGARLGGQLGMPTSGDTILRRVRKTPVLAPESTLRCVGIDDFAFRKGQRYGTVIVDHHTGAVVDLLPERSSESTAAWLKSQPQVEIVTRDRSGLYANGIEAANPQVVQVADRFHLHMNLREAIVRLLDRHHRDVTSAARAVAEMPPAAKAPPIEEASSPPAINPAAVPAPPAVPAVVPKTLQLANARRERRQQRYEEVLALRKEGAGVREIARKLGMSRETVKKFLRAGSFPERARKQSKRTVDAFADQVRRMWDSGVANAQELYRSIKKVGFTGSVSMVQRLVSPWRDVVIQAHTSGPKPTPRASSRTTRISSRRLSWLMLCDETEHKPEEQAIIDRFRADCPPVRMAIDLAREFPDLLKQQQPDPMLQWIERTKQSGVPELKSFAQGLERDWPSVKAAIELPCSNGRAEGHVNRIKLIKRQMYGRANFDLLRLRVLARGP